MSLSLSSSCVYISLCPYSGCFGTLRVLFHSLFHQPSVNGAPSDHPVFGWGGGGGRVYQKAYVEFFASEALLDKVLQACSSLPQLNYYAVSLLCSINDGDVSFPATLSRPGRWISLVKKKVLRTVRKLFSTATGAIVDTVGRAQLL